MVSVDNYFDKFIYRGEDKDRMAVDENKGNRELGFCSFN